MLIIVKLEGRFPWGFRLAKDGTDNFKVSSIVKNGKAYVKGIEIGDVILKVNGVPVFNFTHEGLMSVLRNENIIELEIQRNVKNSADVLNHEIKTEIFNRDCYGSKLEKNNSTDHSTWNYNFLPAKQTVPIYDFSNENKYILEKNIERENLKVSKSEYLNNNNNKTPCFQDFNKPSDEKLQKEWYKNMHKMLHKIDEKQDSYKSIPKWNDKDENDPLCQNIIIRKVDAAQHHQDSSNQSLSSDKPQEERHPTSQGRFNESYEHFDSKMISEGGDLIYRGNKLLKINKESPRENVLTIPWNTKSAGKVQNLKSYDENNNGESRHSSKYNERYRDMYSPRHSRSISPANFFYRNISPNKTNSVVVDDHQKMDRMSHFEPVNKREGLAKAMQDYNGQSLHELSFKQNDFIAITGRVDDHWYEGRLGIKKGFLPVALVQLVREPEDPGKQDSRTKYAIDLQKIVNIFQKDGISFVAIRNVEPRNSDELKLMAGERLLVRKIFDYGWMYGTSMVTNRSGLVLSDYVQLLDS